MERLNISRLNPSFFMLQWTIKVFESNTFAFWSKLHQDIVEIIWIIVWISSIWHDRRVILMQKC